MPLTIGIKGKITDYELNSLFDDLRCFVQDLSASGNGEGGSEQIHEGALISPPKLAVFSFLKPWSPLRGWYSNSRGALTKTLPEPYSLVEGQFISMLRFEHRGKVAELIFDGE